MSLAAVLAVASAPIAGAAASVPVAGAAAAMPAKAVHHRATLTAVIRVAGAPGTAGSATRFSLSAKAPRGTHITGFRIIFGDGSSKSGRGLVGKVSHVYRKAGRYTVTLTVTDSKRKSAKASVHVVVPTGGGTNAALRAELERWTASHPTVGTAGASSVDVSDNATLVSPVPNLYPGAIIQGNPSAIEAGDLQLVGVTPGSGTITLTGIQLASGCNGHVADHVAQDNLPNVTTAVQDLRGRSCFTSKGLDASTMNFQQVTSSSQVKASLEASYAYAGTGSVNASLSEADNTKETHIMFDMEQTYYGISYTPDFVASEQSNTLDAFFAHGVTAAQAAAPGSGMGPGMPPMYISNVVYGTHYIFLASSKSDASAMTAALKADVSVGVQKGNLALSDSQQTTLDETHIQAIAIGGNSSNISQMYVNGALGGQGGAVTDWLKQFVTDSLTTDVNYSVPLAYTLSYLDNSKVGEFAAMTSNTPPAPSDTTSTLYLTVIMGTDDKSWQVPVTVNLYSNTHEHLLNNLVIAGPGNGNGPRGSWNPQGAGNPYCPNPYTGYDYWNNNGSGSSQPPILCTIPLPHPVPIYEIAGATLTIRGPGDSWHAGFDVDFPLSALDALDPAGNYSAAVTPGNMFFNVDPGNGNPCKSWPGAPQGQDGNYAQYTLTLNEPNSPAALQAICPAGGA